MENDLPPEIREAKAQLNEFEKSLKQSVKPKLFSTAIRNLEEYISDNPNSLHKQYILNIIKSHIKISIKQLDDVKLSDARLFYDFLIHVCSFIEKYKEDIFTEEPLLKENYDFFFEKWKFIE